MKTESNEYYKTFHWIVTSGLTCGLTHPIEWAANALSTPGASFHPDYYSTILTHVPTFLVEMYEAYNCTSPTSPEEILTWVNNYYKANSFFQSFFEGYPLDWSQIKWCRETP